MKKNWVKESIYLFFRSFKTGLEFARGLYYLSRLHDPIVTIFGGKGEKVEPQYSDIAYLIADKLIDNELTVITGGGPGLMAAANCGAYDRQKKRGEKEVHTLGIGVYGIDDGFVNPCAKVICVDNFFIRKLLLFRYSQGFIVLPGGIGTMDELFELLNFMKLGSMPRKPIVLIGTVYYKSLVEWIDQAIEADFIAPDCRSLFTVTDDLDEACRLIKYQIKR